MTLLAIDFDNLHQILRNLYTEMMPLCSNMIGVAKGIAGLGALFYVAIRVWQALARAEPIDVYPLLRPFAIGLCIMFFPTFVLGTINAVMSPVVTGTHSILESQTFDMNKYREQKDKLEYEALRRNPETAWLADNQAFDQRLKELGILDAPQIAGMYIERGFYNFKQTVQNWFRELLELPVDYTLHICVPVVACFRLVQFHSGTHPGSDASKGHRTTERSEFCPGR